MIHILKKVAGLREISESLKWMTEDYARPEGEGDSEEGEQARITRKERWDS